VALKKLINNDADKNDLVVEEFRKRQTQFTAPMAKALL
jgi:hypothetical protein